MKIHIFGGKFALTITNSKLLWIGGFLKLNGLLVGLLFLAFVITELNPAPPYALCTDQYCNVSITTHSGFVKVFEIMADIYIVVFPIILLVPNIAMVLPPGRHLWFIHSQRKYLREEKESI